MRNLAFRGLRLPRLGAMRGILSPPLPVLDYSGQAPVASGVLNNQSFAPIGDSRGTFGGAIAGAISASNLYSEDGVFYAQGGADIPEINGISYVVSGTARDFVFEWMEGGIGVSTLIAGVNGAGGGGNLIAEMTKLLKRANCLPVPISSESGTWARDTAGALDGIGVTATSGGNSCTVCATRNDVAYIRDVSGLSSGDTITTAAGWSAVLGTIPAHSGRVMLVISETPADDSGQDFKDYAEWLDTLAVDTTRNALLGPEFTSIRMVHVRDYLWAQGTALNPMPFNSAYTDDGLHPNSLGFAVYGHALRPQIEALLTNYPAQRPGTGLVPSGAAAYMPTVIPLTGASGASLPSGWSKYTPTPATMTLTTGGVAAAQSIIVTGAASEGVATSTMRTRATVSVTMSASKMYRFAVNFTVTNAAGDGPAVNFGDVSARLSYDGAFVQVSTSFNMVFEQWFQTADFDGANFTGNHTFRMDVNPLNETAETDFKVVISDFGIYEITP
jgi:hypothetical protein